MIAAREPQANEVRRFVDLGTILDGEECGHLQTCAGRYARLATECATGSTG
jgi:hypothetical protein